MDKEDSAYQAFLKDMRSTFGAINLGAPQLIKLTGDNGFVEFCNEFCNQMFQNVDEAILEKDITNFETIVRNQHRYLSMLFSSLDIRIPAEEAISAIKKVNYVLVQWLRMAEENEKSYKDLPDNYIVNTNHDVSELNDIVNLSTTVNKQIAIANKLIERAHLVLAASPRAFNMSEHFANAIKKSMEG